MSPQRMDYNYDVQLRSWFACTVGCAIMRKIRLHGIQGRNQGVHGSLKIG